MGLEAVVEEIRAKGQKEAGEIRASAQNEVAKILADAQKRAESTKLSMEAEVEKQTGHIIGQDVAAAHLVVKREVLNTQKKLLDSVYADALKKIAGLPASFHREAIGKLLLEAQKEIPAGIVRCNERDLAVLREVIAGNGAFKGFSTGKAIDIDGGIVIESADSELSIDYSYRTFLNRIWESGLKDASDTLFG
ncbi:MAG: V-type ATP synthase subunit E family protein [Methanoregulaceae archaeon]